MDARSPLTASARHASAVTEREGRSNAAVVPLWSVGVALVLTAVVLVTPGSGFASARTHVAIETIEASAGLLAALISFGRFVTTGRRRHLILVYSLAVLGGANLLAALTAAGGARGTSFTTWAPAIARLAGAALFAVAATTQDESAVASRRRAGWAVVGAATMTLALAALIAAALRDALPAAVESSDRVPDRLSDAFQGATAVLVVQGVSLALFAIAAVGFTRQAHRGGEELLRWFAACAGVSAVARFHYIVYPSLYSNYVYAGDVLRLAAYGLLLAGAIREIRSYWHAMADAAVEAERRRMARDLHDGLAQELAYITGALGRAARSGDDRLDLRNLRAAAERALDEARAAITALSSSAEPSLDDALIKTAEEIGDRLDARVRVTVERPGEAPGEVRQAMVRVLREAVSNAVRHGGASTVNVVVDAGPPCRLTISDSGTGFDTTIAPPADRYGLTSMRDRVAAVGGTFTLTSEPGEGTTIQVTV